MPAARFFLLSAWVSIVLSAGSVPAFPQAPDLWATASGSGPNKFQQQALAHDDAAGPNGTVAVGVWTGAAKRGTFTGFDLTGIDPATGYRLEAVLALSVTAPLDHNRITVEVQTATQLIGPMILPQSAVNQQVNLSGLIRTDLSVLQTVTGADLDASTTVIVRLRHKGSDDGATLSLDAVGLRAVPVNGAGLFDVRIGTDAAQLASQSPLVVDASAPTSISPAACTADLCFVQVVDQAGANPPLSVALMPDGGTIRVGFDDGRPNAPVSAQKSTVTGHATGKADGVSPVQIEVTVVDDLGWPLGGKLDVTLDPVVLGPASPVGGFTDVGDGRYRIDLVALDPGTAVVQVNVEGIALAETVSVLFKTP